MQFKDMQNFVAKKADIDFNDDGLLQSANEVNEVTTSPSRPTQTTRPRYVQTSTTVGPLPTLPTEDTVTRDSVARKADPTSQTEATILSHEKDNQRSRFEDAFNGFYGPDYDAEYDLVNPTKGRPDERAMDSSNVAQTGSGGDRSPFEHDPMTAESVEEDQRQHSGSQHHNQFAFHPPNSYRVHHHSADGLPGFAAPRGFHASTEHNGNAELAADGAGFVMEELMGLNGQAPSSTVEPIQNKNRRHFQEGDREGGGLANNRQRYQGHFDMDKSHSNIKQTATRYAPPLPPNVGHHQMPLSMFLPSLAMPSMAALNQKLPVFVEDTESAPQQSNQLRRKNDKNVVAVPTANGPVLMQQDSREAPSLANGNGGRMSFVQQIASQFIAPGNLLPRFPFRRSRRSTLWDLLMARAEMDSDSKVRRRRSLSSPSGDALKNETMVASESGYYPFEGESSGIPGPVFDYNDFGSNSRRRSQSSSNRRPRKRRPGHSSNQNNNYPPAETRQGKKSYGILGSGNFEVIRGGVYTEEEGSASDNTNNYVRGNGGADNGFTKGDEAEEFFSNDPVLGFQGYDNFHSASNHDENLKKGDKPSSSASSTSHTVFVDTDHDLMATS